MTLLDSLLDIDQKLLLWFNGSESLYTDRMAVLLTSGLTWIPLYVAIFYLVVKNNETMTQIILVLGGSALCILLADGLTDGIIKPLVGRWRPSNDPYIKYMVHVVAGHRDSDYGFFSAHAANTMSIVVFLGLLIRHRLFTLTLLLWSLVNCWTRMYLGLHYPSDIVCGMVWGMIAGLVSYLIYHKLYYKVSPKINYISSQYTSTGYANSDIDIVMLCVVSILVVVTISSLLI